MAALFPLPILSLVTTRLRHTFFLPVATIICLASGPAIAEDKSLSAGDFTIQQYGQSDFAEHAQVLTFQQLKIFKRGRAHFNRKWVQFPSLAGDWGLGPTFIADRCSACHVRAARGKPPQTPDEAPVALLLRISLPGTDDHGAPEAHPSYGKQIQNQGLMGQDRDGTFLGERVYPEAEFYIDWTEHEVAFSDGESVTLRTPNIRWDNLYFGPVGDEVLTSLRIAQQLPGLGLLEAIPEQTILALANQQKKAQRGISGKPNYVWDYISERQMLGRFGWKANVPTIKQQIAEAFAEDIGVTSPIFLDMNCPLVQTDCAAQPPGNQPELINLDWEQLEFWNRTLGVPARRNVDSPQFENGERLFAETGCAACHIPELRTAELFEPLPQLANQIIRPYTDLLLHDMGEGLADGRPDFQAESGEWRTPPLWGLGLATELDGPNAGLLHDGRARTATEAILWHGGEALDAREAFQSLSKTDREALLAFLKSI